MTESHRPHVIRRDQVRTWLADSVNISVTVHTTDAFSARTIREHGVDLLQIASDAGFGRAFYTSRRMIPEYGDSSVRVAVRLLRPLFVRGMLDAAEHIDELLLRYNTENYSAALFSAGYDGIMVDDAPGDGWVIAYRIEQVRVVEG